MICQKQEFLYWELPLRYAYLSEGGGGVAAAAEDAHSYVSDLLKGLVLKVVFFKAPYKVEKMGSLL